MMNQWLWLTTAKKSPVIAPPHLVRGVGIEGALSHFSDLISKISAELSSLLLKPPATTKRARDLSIVPQGYARAVAMEVNFLQSCWFQSNSDTLSTGFFLKQEREKVGKRLNRTKTIDCRFRRTIVRFYYSFTHLTSIVRRSIHQNDHLDGLMSCHEAKIFSSKQTRVSIQNGNTIDHFVAFGLVKEKVGQKGWKPLKVGSNHCKAKPLRNYFRRFKFKYILGTSKINQRLEKCVPNVLLLYN